MTQTDLPDGLEALRAELDLKEIMRLIERTARWVDPETFRLLPLWYPEYARGVFYYNDNWKAPRNITRRQTKESRHKTEGNIYANKALTEALGLRRDDRPNWTCCHIWGVDDAKYQIPNVVVQDRRYFSCIANMVLLPMPLKAFTDAMPDVKAMLRICARNLYDWHCDREEVADAVKLIDDWQEWSAYPASWPRKIGERLPRGTIRLRDDIRKSATRRLDRIRDDLVNAGPFYPRAEVREALAHWRITL